MSKWCDKCYKAEVTGQWQSCGNHCLLFGKDVAGLTIEEGVERYRKETGYYGGKSLIFIIK